MSEPRPGYRTTMIVESVDPDGLRMSDVTCNWYGREKPEDNLAHNAMAISIVQAVTESAKHWSAYKAEDRGVTVPDAMKA